MRFIRALWISFKVFLVSLILWAVYFPFIGFILAGGTEGQPLTPETLLLILVPIVVVFQIVAGAVAVYFVVGAAVEEARRPGVLSKPHLVGSSESVRWCPECQNNVEWEGWDGLLEIAGSEALKAGFTFDITLVCKDCGYKRLVRLPKDIPSIVKATKKRA